MNREIGWPASDFRWRCLPAAGVCENRGSKAQLAGFAIMRGAETERHDHDGTRLADYLGTTAFRQVSPGHMLAGETGRSGMELHDILVCIDGTAAGELRSQLALNLAQASKAHLTTVYALREPRGLVAPPAGVGLPPTVLGPVSPEGARVMEGQPISAAAPVAQVLREAERADAIEERLREELNSRGLNGEWHIVDHTDMAGLIELAQTADLAILGQYPGDDSGGVTWLRPDHVVTGAGRPVLVIPYVGNFARVGTRVLVAWDGTREANRALHDALPLIANAEAVIVLYVATREPDLDRERSRLERVIRHLQRHRVKAQTEEAPRGGISISDVLLSRAADLGADMIVAGAYHHSQLREALLGGVSRDLLDHMTVPVLMSH